MTMGGATQGKDLVQSGINIGQGKGSAGDYLTVGLAPFALAGFGAGGAAAKGLKAASRSPEVARALALQALRNPNIVSRQGIDVLENMARSGDTRFRSVFEINPSDVTRFQEYQKRGLMNPAALSEESARRAASEQSLLGIPLDAPVSARPVYGVVTPKVPFLASGAPKPQGQQRNVLEQMRSALSPRNPFLEEYGAGQANVVFDPKKLGRVTATAGDVGSGAFGGARGAAEDLGTKGIRNVAEKSVVDYKGTPSVPPYLEAQMYGANLANAKRVTVPTKDARNRLAQLFKEQGIKVPVKVDRGAVRQSAREKAVQDRLTKLRNQEREWESEL
jgi:F0F1-type ATP synthase membrane subunit c/vacuolar-type H+-ATPase subunit K